MRASRDQAREKQAGPVPGHGVGREQIAEVLADAAGCVAPGRVADTAAEWLQPMDLSSVPPEHAAMLFAEALAMATIVALFTPSAGGTTALDRLARQWTRPTPAETTALAMLRKTQFRLLTVQTVRADGPAQLQDVSSNETVQVEGDAISAGCVGLRLAAWLAPLPNGRHMVVGQATPLDEAGFAVAMGFVRPGRPALVNGPRCAAAVYRQVVRNGTLRIPGLNHGVAGSDDEWAEDTDEFDQLARQWAEPGATRAAEDERFVRSQTSPDCIIRLLAAAAYTREEVTALSAAYLSLAQIQIETVHRRASAGSGSLRLEDLEASVAASVATEGLPPIVRTMFETIRRRLGVAATAGRAGADGELDKLIGRIQGLRAKTVEHGCTEQEALAAAEKVADLLDRYGLSLSELDLRRQACEGSAVDTERKRVGPIDECVPEIAAFFDCRVWGEKAGSGTLRYVFFGLRADVVAARYLYDLVDQAFTRETAMFRVGETYAALPSTTRRTATNSFQIGLGRGIVAKLHALRTAREATLRGSSGRDLVVVKAGIVDAEMAALGLSLRTHNPSGGRRLLKDAFDQGLATGLRFEHTQGIASED